jgi:hypothetical protein
MPSAQSYYGHSLEFITLLPDALNSGFNGAYSKWNKALSQSHDPLSSATGSQ